MKFEMKLEKLASYIQLAGLAVLLGSAWYGLSFIMAIISYTMMMAPLMLTGSKRKRQANVLLVLGSSLILMSIVSNWNAIWLMLGTTVMVAGACHLFFALRDLESKYKAADPKPEESLKTKKDVLQSRMVWTAITLFILGLITGQLMEPYWFFGIFLAANAILFIADFFSKMFAMLTAFIITKLRAKSAL
ncbi:MULTISPECIES: hypothetical protein [Aeromonas]|uniref:hypothetical protein n=1 Tax=Aeromonas TaxID=642 RepID=UPI002B05CF98|nr:hypothetical protein [Aeromonas jandaei]